MDNMLEFSVSTWGITLSSAPLYFNLSWGMVIVIIGGYLVHRVISNRKAQALWQQAIDDEAKRG